jgi:hypothetical protein
MIHGGNKSGNVWWRRMGSQIKCSMRAGSFRPCYFTGYQCSPYLDLTPKRNINEVSSSCARFGYVVEKVDTREH